jgi:hypothetical protein
MLAREFGHPRSRIFGSQLAIGVLLVVGVLAGCSDNGSTTGSPAGDRECDAGATITIGVGQAETLDCSNGTTVQLAANGASYLVVPQFATGNVSDAATQYALSATGGTGAVAQVASIGGVAAGAAQTLMPPHEPRNRLQMLFDARLRSAEREAVAGGKWTFSERGASLESSRSGGPSQSLEPPALQSTRDFRVISSFNASNSTFVTVSGKLQFVGSNILIYVDTLAPANGFTADQLNAFGRLFDQTLYSIDISAFGVPSDIDGNGRLIVLLSPRVNALTPAAQCATDGYIAGFFDGFDLSSTSSNSNRGEIYYGLVPDPSGQVSCSHSVEAVSSVAPATFLHELQHLISFSQHVVLHHGNSEEGWLDEGMSIVAEELGSVHYEQKFPPPSGRSNPAQLFPDSSQGFISGLLGDSYAYLLKTDTTTLTLRSDADGGLNWRGGDWLLLRWLGDQKGAAFYKALEQSTLTGTANIAAQAGEQFQSLFGDFSLALYTDSVVGIPRSSIPPRDRFVTRTLRPFYQALFNAEGPSPNVPRAFPIAATTLTGTVTATLVPGTMSFYQLSTASGTATTMIHFASPGGGPLPANLHPQLSVFRLH